MTSEAPAKEGIKIVCENRKAFHNYFFEERFEAGLELKGTEVKSLRAGQANLNDSYAIFKNNELYLLNAHINPYAFGNLQNHEPLRSRRLLLHREELNKLWTRAEIKGYTLIPLKLYFKKGLAKVEIGVGRGKKAHDKRASTKEREAKREMDRVTKRKHR